MKKLIFTLILALLAASWSIARAQEQPDEFLGLPGDNLNLYAVMKLFQESETLEGFEKKLNDENSRINNLDLNGDNLVDYIMVVDYPDGEVHNIVLRVALNRNENQDVAIFTVQRYRNGSVQIQLIGDEALYGKNYIVEPVYAETPNPGYTGRSAYRRNVTVVETTGYEIAAWPLIRFIFLPGYIAWHSLWYWDYYPSYWNPWRPYYWHFYYGYHSHWHDHYYRYYRHCDFFRNPHYYNHYYSNVRVFSPEINIRINKGIYRSTYSHPEQRRDGEAFYSRMHSSRGSELKGNTTVNTNGRRNDSQSIRGQNNRDIRNTDERRVSVIDNSKSIKNSSGFRGADKSARPASSVSGRRITENSAAPESGFSRRSTSSVTERSNVESSGRQERIVSRRSSSGISGRTSSGPSFGSSGSARSTSSVTGRTISKPSVNQSGSDSRRFSPTLSGRSTSRPSYSRDMTSSGRSSSSVSERAVARPSMERSLPQEHRSAPAVSEKSASRSSYGQSSYESRRSSSVSTNRSVPGSSAVRGSSGSSGHSASKSGSERSSEGRSRR